MPLTVDSSGSSYLPALEFLKRADVRRVADLVSDNGQRVGGSPNPDPTVVAANANLTACLLDASGALEAACIRGQRYQPADLAVLAATPGAGQGWLFRFLTRLTMYFLYDRREDLGPIPEKYKLTMEELGEIADGSRILSFAEAEEAGLQFHEVEGAETIRRREGTVVQAGRYFGRRANRSDPSRP